MNVCAECRSIRIHASWPTACRIQPAISTNNKLTRKPILISTTRVRTLNGLQIFPNLTTILLSGRTQPWSLRNVDNEDRQYMLLWSPRSGARTERANQHLEPSSASRDWLGDIRKPSGFLSPRLPLRAQPLPRYRLFQPACRDHALPSGP